MPAMVDELVAGVDVVKKVENSSELDRVFETHGVKRTKIYKDSQLL